MKLFRVKEWPVLELTVFKITCLAFGMMFGAYLTEFVKQHLWIFLAVAIAGWIKVTYFYYVQK